VALLTPPPRSSFAAEKVARQEQDDGNQYDANEPKS